MSALLSLITDPARHTLDSATIARLGEALGAAPVWLGDGEAVELPLTADTADTSDSQPALAQARALFADRPVDINIVPGAKRRKRLLLADMDSTMITVECLDELADFVGKKAEVAAVTQRAMNGELDFAQALRERVALLDGLAADALQRAYDERVRLTPGGPVTVATMRAHGADTALVSGGFTFFTARVAAACGFARHEANVLGIRDGRLTGEVEPPIRDKSSKLALLEALLTEHGLDPADALTLGDGANDLPMLQRAGLGVAYRAHAAVRAHIPVQVNHADLRAVLYLQGYRRAEFVDPALT